MQMLQSVVSFVYKNSFNR